MIVVIEEFFSPYASAALQRLRYVFPNHVFDLSGCDLNISGPSLPDETTLRREVAFQLYREKIYQDGLPMRSAMYAALLK